MKIKRIQLIAILAILATTNCGFFWNEVSRIGKSKEDTDLITLALLANASRGSGSLGNLSPEELVTVLTDITSPLGQASVSTNVASTAGSSAVGLNNGNTGGALNSARSKNPPGVIESKDLENWAREGFDPYSIQSKSAISINKLSRDGGSTGIQLTYSEESPNRRSGTFEGSEHGVDVTRTEGDEEWIYKANGIQCGQSKNIYYWGSESPQGLATFTNGEFVYESSQNRWSGSFKSNIRFDNFGSFYVDPIVIAAYYKAIQESNLFNRCNRQVFTWDSNNRISINDFQGNQCSCAIINPILNILDTDFRATIDGSISTEYNYSNETIDSFRQTTGDITVDRFRSRGNGSSIATSLDGIQIRKNNVDSGRIILQNLRYSQDFDIRTESSYKRNRETDDFYTTDYTLFSIRGFFRLRIQGNINGQSLNESLNMTF